ncbi:hypothetical protein [Saccharothrix deserti]|uniref:hypothetical protein n=1 Tax=Saccharothrix deserti TaxID=2593674 RepID=UPI00131BA04D|nr:hypothetical protein [Saccharothrix deserti]
MSTRSVPIAGYESMTLQVRADLGERRLVAAVRSLFVRHEVLRSDGFTAESCVRRVVSQSDTALEDAALGGAGQEDVPGDAPLRVVWFDGGTSGRIVLAVRRDVLARLPWHVLLPGLVSAWNASTHLRRVPLSTR